MNAVIDKRFKLVQASSPRALTHIASETIETVLTSPPYYGKYSYASNLDIQLGMERHVGDYVKNLQAIAVELLRICRPGAVFWLNIGDTYNNYSAVRTSQGERRSLGRPEIRRELEDGYWEKELLGVPFLIKDAFKEVGWPCRSVNIWSKPSPGLDCAEDRPLVTHEYFLQFVKPAPGKRRLPQTIRQMPSSVWNFNPSGFPGHPAAYPEDLVEFVLQYCTGEVVLDPFMGSGTTGVVACKLGKYFIGVEPCEEYFNIAKKRIEESLMQTKMRFEDE
jgi:DNA modification methylase